MRYRSIPVLALLAVTGALAAGCSSSASPSPSSTSATTGSAPAPSESATGAGTGGSTLSAADCAVVKPIAAGAITTLAPLQTESASAAAGTLNQFVGQLGAAQGKVSSPQAKSDIGALITALSQAGSNSTASQTAITTALAKLGSDCP
jgi:hypothetical protein